MNSLLILVTLKEILDIVPADCFEVNFREDLIDCNAALPTGP